MIHFACRARFSWATRLEPKWADALYARRIALPLNDRRRLVRYWEGERQIVPSDDIRRIDSLFYRALTLEPSVSQRLDHELFDVVIAEVQSPRWRVTVELVSAQSQRGVDPRCATRWADRRAHTATPRAASVDRGELAPRRAHVAVLASRDRLGLCRWPASVSW
jgi:hypothetical protein